MFVGEWAQIVEARDGGEAVDVVPLTCTVCRGAWQLQRHHDSS